MARFVQLSACLALAAASLSPLAAKDRQAGSLFRDADFAPQMVVIPAGKIMLGSTEAETTREGRSPTFAAFERPQREVMIDKPFAIGKFHVTRREYARFAKATKRKVAGCVVATGDKWSDGPLAEHSFDNTGFPQRDDEPALCVSWDDANAYAEWLSKRTRKRYRLPTEAEWEYAARGGSESARWWGNETQSVCTRANGGDQDYSKVMPADKTANPACADGFAFTNPVDHFPPNPFGLHDMLGNAWQWVADCFSAVPSASVPTTPCASRSIRGGSWHNSVSTLRPATRFSLPPDMRSSSLGFRVMRELP